MTGTLYYERKGDGKGAILVNCHASIVDKIFL